MKLASKQKDLLHWGHNLFKGIPTAFSHQSTTPNGRLHSNFVHANTNSPSAVPGEKQRDLLTPSEERDLEEIIRDSSNLENIDILVTGLNEQITELEDENMQGILRANEQVSKIVSALENCMSQLNRLEGWIGENYRDLERMKIDLNSIEGTNSKVQIRSTNQRLLQKELSLLESNISYSDDRLDFDVIDYQDEKEAERTLSAVRDLMQLRERINTGEVSEMQTIQKILSQLTQQQHAFVKSYSHHVETRLEDLAGSAIESRRKQTKKGDLQLRGYQGVREGLLKYVDLMECLRVIDLEEHNKFMEDYKSTMKTVYKKAFSHFFGELRQYSFKDFKKHFRLLPLGDKLEHKEPKTKKMAGAKGDSSSLTTSNLSDTESEISFFIEEDTIESGTPTSTEIRNEPNSPRGDKGGLNDNFAKTKKGEMLKGSRAFQYALSFILSAIKAETEFVWDFFGFKANETDSRYSISVLNCKHMCTVIFETLPDELKSFGDWLDKHDPLNNISIILAIEETKEKLKESNYFIVDNLDDLLETHEKKLQKFIKEQIDSIQECKIGAKRCGIVPCFFKMPHFVSAVESMTNGMSRPKIDQMYSGIVRTMFDWMITMAQQTPKYTQMAIMENMHFFYTSLAEVNVKPLQEYIEKAKTLYGENLRGYLSWHVEKQFPKFVKFFNELMRLLLTVSEEEVQFESSHSKESAKKMIRNSDQSFDKSIIKMYKRMRKHLGSENELLFYTWGLLVEHFVEKYKDYDGMIKRCYKGMSLLPQSETIRDRIEAIILGYQARHKDGAYDSPSETASTFSVARSSVRAFGSRR